MPIFCWWFEPFLIFPYIGIKIIPTDFHSIIFQRGRYTNHQPAIFCWLHELNAHPASAKRREAAAACRLELESLELSMGMSGSDPMAGPGLASGGFMDCWWTMVNG